MLNHFISLTIIYMKIALISALFFWKTVLLRGELQINEKKSNFRILERPNTKSRSMPLRLLTESLILIGSARFGATLNRLVTRVGRTNVSFGTLTDGRLEINSLALNNFQWQKRLPKWRQSSSKMVLQNPIFCQIAQSFMLFGPYDFIQISLTCGTNNF